MKKRLYTLASAFLMFFLFFVLTAQRTPDQRRFYYAFNEKIYIDPVPGKYALAFELTAQADDAAQRLRGQVKEQDLVRVQPQVLVLQLATGQALSRMLTELATQPVTANPAYRTESGQEYYYTDEVILELGKGENLPELIRMVGLGKEAIKEEKEFFTILKLPKGLDAIDIANRIQETGKVVFAHPNFINPLELHQVIPNDTYFPNQYYMRNVGQVFNPAENHAGTPGADNRASWAWTMTTGSNNIIVAVLDQGVSDNHPDLPNTRQVRLNGSNFIAGENANNPSPAANENHGNSCAGVIAATQNNNEGISGMAPNVRIMPIRILTDNSSASNAGMASAIDFAWQHGADVLSNSWGFRFETNPNAVPAIVQAIQRATTQGRNGRGSVVAFSASNSASHNFGVNGEVRFPSNVQINSVLTVGASNRFDQQADYSPTSNLLSSQNQVIDICAPSHNAYPNSGLPNETFEVWTLDIPGNNGYNSWHDAVIGFPAVGEVLPNFGPNNLSYTGRFGGTSAACPQIAGAAALMLSVNPNLSPQQVFDILTQTADKVGGYTYNNGWCNQLGSGRLDACEAVSRAIQQVPLSGSDDCGSGTVYAPAVATGTMYNWQVSGDLLINGVSTSVITTDNFINFSGTNGTVYVTATTPCGVFLQWWYGFNPHQRQIQGLYPEYTHGDQVSVSVNTTGFDTYYRWYVNNTLVKEGTSAYYYCTCYYETPEPRVCGDNTIRVEVETNCGVTTVQEEHFWWICGYYRTQPNVQIFPNPARDKVTLRLTDLKLVGPGLKNMQKPGGSSTLLSIREVRLFDKIGNLKGIYRYGEGSTVVTLSVSALPMDVYYLEITDGRSRVRLPLSVRK